MTANDLNPAIFIILILSVLLLILVLRLKKQYGKGLHSRTPVDKSSMTEWALFVEKNIHSCRCPHDVRICKRLIDSFIEKFGRSVNEEQYLVYLDYLRHLATNKWMEIESADIAFNNKNFTLTNFL